MTTLTPKDYIQKYRNLGFRIYALEPNTKFFSKDVKNFMGKPEINELIMQGAGIALMMGYPSDGDDYSFFALDFDDEQAYQKWATDNPEVAQTATAKTNRGYHVLFKMDWTTRSAKSEKISIISEGWYIAVEPSVHPSGQSYKWIIPPWDNICMVKSVRFATRGIDLEKLEWEPDDYDDRNDDDDYYDWAYS